MILNICTNPDLLKVVLIVKNIINILKVVIPLLLIVFLMLDLVKGIISDKEDKVMANIKIIPRRLIAAALFFLVPTIMDVTLNIMDENLNIEYVTCITNAESERIKELYLERAEEAVAKVEASLDKIDLYDAENYVSKLNSEENMELKELLTKRLKTTSEKIYNTSKKEESTNNVIYNSGNFPYYDQCDKKWSPITLSGHSKDYDTCHKGCGVTALSMILSGLNNDSRITPKTVMEYIATYSTITGAYGESDLTHKNIKSKYDINAKILFRPNSGLNTSKQREVIIEELKQNHPIILLIPNHYIVLYGLEGDKVLMYNPSYLSKSGKFTLEEIYNNYYNHKNKCTNEGICGFRMAISYSKA